MSQRERSLEGMKVGGSIAIGYFPVAMAFGFAATEAGLNISEAMLLSVSIFAGASQFAMLGLIAQMASPLWTVMTAVLLNVRHLLFSFAMAPRTCQWNYRQIGVVAFGITDETFAATNAKDGEITFPYMFYIELLAYGAWIIGTITGGVLRQGLPFGAKQALTFALTAMFVSLLIPGLKQKASFIAAAVGAITAALCLYVGFSSLCVLVAGILGASAGMGVSLWSGKSDQQLSG